MHNRRQASDDNDRDRTRSGDMPASTKYIVETLKDFLSNHSKRL